MTAAVNLYIGPLSVDSVAQYGQVAFGPNFLVDLPQGFPRFISDDARFTLGSKENFDELDATELCEHGVERLVDPEVDSEIFAMISDNYQDFYAVFEEAGLLPVKPLSSEKISAQVQSAVDFDDMNFASQPGFYSQDTLRAVYCNYYPANGEIYCHYGNHFELTDEGVVSVPPTPEDPGSRECFPFSRLTLDGLVEDPSVLEEVVACE